MIHKCVIGGCPNQSDTIIHYMLPMEPKRRSLWVKFIDEHNSPGASTRDDEIDIGSSSRVCGDHFPEESFFVVDLGNSTRRILSVDAVPTIHIYPVPESVPETREPENENMNNEIYNINISDAFSLACVKDEPLETELSQNTPVRQEPESVLEADVKEEEMEHVISVVEKQSQGKHKFVTCLKCGDRFLSRRALIKHRQELHSRRKIIYEETERVNIKPREGISESKHVCHQCGKNFEHQAFLKAHQKVHEGLDSNMRFSCDLCSKRFGDKVALVAHMKQHSSQVSGPKCPICEKNFQFRGSLIQHIKSIHVGEKLACKICQKSFRLIHGFIKHMDKHNVITPYHCKRCQIYLSERGFRIHMLRHKQKKEISNADWPEGREIEPLSEEETEDAPEESSLEAGREELQQEDQEVEKEDSDIENSID